MPALVEFAGDLSDERAGISSRDAITAARSERGRPTHVVSGSQPEDFTRVLLVGCGPELQGHLYQRLLQPHWSVHEARGGSEALDTLRRRGSDLVVLAPWLPDLDVNECQELIESQFPAVQVITVEELAPKTARSSSALGELLNLHNAARAVTSSTSVQHTREQISSSGWNGLLGSSEAMRKIFRLAELVAKRDTTVLIQGESGTGKDLLARAIHQASARAKQPFVVINCAAIPETLLEAELFGYTKGSFTGASQAKLGRVHSAHGGTLFLDEIGDMPLPLQSKILRFLEQGEVQRIGGTETLKVDCRIVAATNADLKKQVKANLFREDLYYRLAVVPMTLPPLRDRMDDFHALCEQLVNRFCPGTEIHPEAERMLLEYAWPGNIRELRNVVERASLLADGRDQILPEDLFF